MSDSDRPEPHIGTLNEGSLHAALKERYAEPGDEFEVPLDGFVIDVRRGNLLIEIQTSNLAAMGRKLDRVLDEYQVHLVHPIAVGTWLQRPDAKPRKSPKKMTVYNIFDELVSVPTLLDHPSLTLDVVLTNQTKVQVHDPKARRGRGGFRTVDRQLREVIAVETFTTVDDLCRLLPGGLPNDFTTADLASLAGVPREIAQKMAYCFRPLGVFVETGRTKKGITHRLA